MNPWQICQGLCQGNPWQNDIGPLTITEGFAPGKKTQPLANDIYLPFLSLSLPLLLLLS